MIEINQSRQVSELPDPAAFLNNLLVSDIGEVGVRIPIVTNGVIPVSPLPYSIVTKNDIPINRIDQQSTGREAGLHHPA